jgi:hypothetical protein
MPEGRNPTNQEELRAWSARWKQVSDRQAHEIQKMSVTDKATVVSRLMGTQVSDETTAKREAEVKAVRSRWARLRELYGILK